MAYKRISPQPVIEGGTGVQSNTAYAVLCGGTTSTSGIQSIASVGTANQVLTSNGAGNLPTFQNPAASSAITSITGNSGGAQSGPAITLTGGSTGASFGGAANTITMTFAGITANGGTVSLSSDNANGAVAIGTGSAVKTVTVGSTNTTSSLALRYGTSDFTLASATGTTISALDTGEVTMPLQPAFLAYVNTTIPDVTGNNTLYTVIFDTERYDQGADFNLGTSTFTAPVTGRYHFCFGAYLADLSVAFSQGNMFLLMSNYNAGFNQSNYGAIQTGTAVITGGDFYTDMDAADTANFAVRVSGSTLTIDVVGLATSGYMSSFFSGVLVV